ncbi:hypothetical protein HBI67_214610 [Parastagonospora nodorum]|nr:hypothetical protein HBI47_205940 [Parastagonospora nodorum]KAH6050040.1 hypothetical protein HBI67_214610 [Parastagonospora nodorum]KAH6063023.1 hypothetical protein HBI66_178840 [Parastagonospora nodorum]
MQFSTVVLALAATASAAVLPRANPQGQWLASLTLGPVVEDLYLTAEFTSDDYSGDNKLHNACVQNGEGFHRCDHVEFDFSYDGATLNLTQNLPNGVTVFGSVPFPVTTYQEDGSFRDTQIVPVTSAIA